MVLILDAQGFLLATCSPDVARGMVARHHAIATDDPRVVQAVTSGAR